MEFHLFCGLIFTSPVNAVDSINFPVISYGWMSEEKAAKEAGMDPENYQVGSRVATGGEQLGIPAKKPFRNDVLYMFQDGPAVFVGKIHGWKIETFDDG